MDSQPSSIRFAISTNVSLKKTFQPLSEFVIMT